MEELRMVAALVGGKRIEIRNLDDLASVVESSRYAAEPLVLVDDREERFVINPADDVERAERRAKLEAAFGSWKGLVDTEKLEREVYASRGQRGRDWFAIELDDDPR
jgi:hypothetical protein